MSLKDFPNFNIYVLVFSNLGGGGKVGPGKEGLHSLPAIWVGGEFGLSL